MADILDSAQKNTDGIVVSPPEPEPARAAPPDPISALEVPVTPPPQQITTAVATKPVVNPITGSSSMVAKPQAEPTPEQSKSQLTPNEPTLSHESGKLDALIVPPPNAPPPKDNNSSNVSSKRKPKLGAVIAGLLLLLLTLPIAIYYISQQNNQQQDIRSRAADIGPYPTQPDLTGCVQASSCACGGQTYRVCNTTLRDSHGSSCSDWCANPYTDTTPNYTTLGSQCNKGSGDSASCSKLKTACISGNSSACSNLCGTARSSNETTCVPGGIGCAGAAAGDTYCTTWHWTNCTNAGTGQNGVGCDVNNPGGGGGGGGNTDTPTPTPGSECTAIQVFKNDTQLDAAGMAALQPGDAVVITVAGANASKAHIRINGGAWIESTTLNSSGAYTFNYTIPSDITNFTIESEIFGSDGNWH